MSEQVGTLPRGWSSLRLDEIAEVRLGRQRSPERATGDHMCQYLRAGNITWNGLALDDVKEMDFTPTEQAIYRLVPGDILMSEASGSASEVGKPAVWNDQIPGACFQNTLLRVRPPRGLTKYLFWHLMADAVLGRFVDQSPGVGIHHLGATRLSRWQIRLAPEGERQAIAKEIEKQLTRIEAGAAALKRVQANLKRYRASVLNAACQGRLVSTEAELARRESRDYEPASVLLESVLKERRRHWEAAELAKLKAKGKPPTDDRWKAKYKTPESADTTRLLELPVGWCWATLEQLSWDSGYGTSAKCEAEAEGAPVLRIPNLVDGAIDLAKLKFSLTPLTDASEALAPGDFLVVRTNGSKDLIGKGGLVMNQFPRLHFFASYLIRFRLVPVGTLSSWVAAYWRSPDARSQVIANAATSAGQYNVSLTELSRIVVPLPPQSEQKRILTEFERLFGLANRLGDAAATDGLRAERLRQSILRSAFEGKLTSPPAVLSAGKPTPNPPPPRTGGTTVAELSHA